MEDSSIEIIIDNIIFLYQNLTFYEDDVICTVKHNNIYTSRIESRMYFKNEKKGLNFISTEIDTFQGGNLINSIIGNEQIYLYTSSFTSLHEKLKNINITQFLPNKEINKDEVFLFCKGNEAITSLLLINKDDDSHIFSKNKTMSHAIESEIINGIDVYKITQFENRYIYTHENEELKNLFDISEVNRLNSNRKIEGFDKKIIYWINKQDSSILKIEEETIDIVNRLRSVTYEIKPIFNKFILDDLFKKEHF